MCRWAPLLLLTVARALVAQGGSTPLPAARAGLIGGVNFSEFAAPGLQDVARRTALVGGVTLVTPFAAHFASQLEGLYSMKGSRSVSSTSTDNATFKFDYIEVPVMLRGDAPVRGRLKPFAYTGPALNFLINCEAEAKSAVGTETATCKEIEAQFSSGSTFRKFDVGWLFGGGVQLGIGERTFSLSARYELGMRTIATIGESKSRVLSLMLSVESLLPRKTIR